MIVDTYHWLILNVWQFNCTMAGEFTLGIYRRKFSAASTTRRSNALFCEPWWWWWRSLVNCRSEHFLSILFVVKAWFEGSSSVHAHRRRCLKIVLCWSKCVAYSFELSTKAGENAKSPEKIFCIYAWVGIVKSVSVENRFWVWTRWKGLFWLSRPIWNTK